MDFINLKELTEVSFIDIVLIGFKSPYTLTLAAVIIVSMIVGIILAALGRAERASFSMRFSRILIPIWIVSIVCAGTIIASYNFSKAAQHNIAQKYEMEAVWNLSGLSLNRGADSDSTFKAVYVDPRTNMKTKIKFKFDRETGEPTILNEDFMSAAIAKSIEKKY